MMKQISWQSRSHLAVLTCCLLLLSLSACYEPTEGCLNPRATNFDLDADEACSNCCSFPELSVVFSHVWDYGDTIVSLSTDTFYLDKNNQPWRFKRARFYWSAVALQRSSLGELQITDSITFSVANMGDTTSISTLDDYLLIDTDDGSSTTTIGALEPEGTLEQLNVRFGLSPDVNRALSTSVPDDHPLAPQLGNLNYGTETGYVFAKLEFYKDTIATDTVAVEVNIFGDAFSEEFMLPLSSPTAFVEGFDPQLTVQVDFAAWFNNLDLRNADTTSLKAEFVNNMTNTFQLLSLENR